MDYTEVFVALYLVPRYWADTSSLHLPLDNKDRYTVDTRSTSIPSRYKTKIDKTIQRRRTIDTVRGVLLILFKCGIGGSRSQAVGRDLGDRESK